MFNIEKRSLSKKSDKLTDADKSFLRKYTCEHEGCGKDFEFSITEEAYDQKNERNRRFAGHCKKCGQKLILSNYQIKRWIKLISGSTLNVNETTFSKLFDEE
ncbi:hypothetical protein shim_09840 [Shimia sp. SK013]|uniref:hypothetical protein n=1 Tax=Shimia sp. SK013 TaxID=1389006 RepID=UPI0006CDB892|nr:hypothetical protein [Shimia sp. SK013]KPA22697.1 hypothetical protein shim_09840 [Shimia sp. SK013]